MTFKFYNWDFAPHHPFCLFCPSPLPFPLAITHLFSVSVSLFLPFCVCLLLWFLFFFKIPYISEIIWYLSFSDLFHLAQYPLGPSMLSQMARCHSFLWLSDIPLYKHTPHLLYSSMDGHFDVHVFGPCLGYCK